MDNRLTTDEYDALEQIGKAVRGERPSACIARNSKKLNGLKFISHAKDGHLTLTDKGQQTLFLKQCIDALRAIETESSAPVRTDVTQFLLKKGHVEHTDQGGFKLTVRGRESLADIEASSR